MNSRSLARSVRRFHAGNSLAKRFLLRFGHILFIVQPDPLRRVTTAAYIASVLQLKRILGVERLTQPTPMDEVGTLSFWGVPAVDAETFTLTLDGWVERPQVLRFDELLTMPSEQRAVRMDCVGGFRNNTIMRGVSLAALLERAGPHAGARRAIFSCADGYSESSTLADLEAAEAMIADEIDGQRVSPFPAHTATSGPSWSSALKSSPMAARVTGPSAACRIAPTWAISGSRRHWSQRTGWFNSRDGRGHPPRWRQSSSGGEFPWTSLPDRRPCAAPAPT